ncbi:MAG: hypothetical protein ACKESB_01125 [Candidatus Hodgkinia cicadicola]
MCLGGIEGRKWVSAGVEYRLWKLEDCAFNMFETWLRISCEIQNGEIRRSAEGRDGQCVLHWKMMG